VIRYYIETIMIGSDTVVRVQLVDQPTVVLTSAEALTLGHTLTIMGAKAEVYKGLQRRARRNSVSDGSRSDNPSSGSVSGLRLVDGGEE
jgi:hypothetical protein